MTNLNIFIYKQRGLSLIENMVALTIGLSLLSGFITLYLGSKQTYAATEEVMSLQDNGCYAIELLAQEIGRAGYFGDNPFLQQITGTIPPVAPTATCSTRSNDWGRMLTQPIFGLDNSASSYDCIATGSGRAAYFRGDIITTRYASPSVTHQFDNQRIYLRTSPVAAKLFIGRSYAHPANIITDTNAAREVQANSFYVAYSGRRCKSEAIPALFRKKLNYAGLPESEELISGIENLQAQYGIDKNDDHIIDYFADATSSLKWTQVAAIRIWVLARSECTQSTTLNSNQTFVLGNDLVPSNPKLRQRLFTVTVPLFNKVKIYAKENQI